MRFQLRQEAQDGVLPEASPDAADIDEVIALVHADKKRAEAAVGRRPAADDDLVPGPALRFGPAVAPS